MGKSIISIQFNWAAFFLTGAWVAYRKMYWQFLVLLGATIVLSIIVQTLGISLTWVASLVVGLVCGTYGDRWYHNHSLRVIRKARLKAPRADERIKLLAKRGKKTNPKVLIAVIAAIFVAFLIATLVTPTLNNPAAEQKSSANQYDLGLKYALGQGVAKDLTRAYMWWDIAASLGNKDAKRKRGIIEEQMIPADVLKAKQLAKECIAKGYKDC
jgi:hypothetical protein